MKHSELAERLLAHVARPGYQPVKPRVLAKKLDLDDDQRHALRAVIKRLVRAGKLTYGANHLVAVVLDQVPPELRGAASPEESDSNATPVDSFDAEAGEAALEVEGELESDEAVNADSAPAPAERPRKKKKGPEGRRERESHDRKVVSGTFRRTSSGYGFVRPKGAASGDRSGDVYIPAEASLDAASGDFVTVRLDRRFRQGQQRVSGEIVEVLERDTHRFVGVYEERPDGGYVQIDGNVFSQPISVGDPGAKGARAGDKVVVEMVRFPSHRMDGEAVVVEVLGPRGQPGVDTLSILREFDLPDEFPEEVLEDARQQADRFDEENLEGRDDWTAATIITIDPLDARDFDDAISLTRLDQGHWQLGVHIADVAHFVPLKSHLDREARERATSVYLPDRVLPMLPEVISNNLASLQPHRTRYARTVLIEFSHEGVRVAADVRRTAIRSKRRFTYEEVDEYLAQPDAFADKLPADVHQLLGRMHELAMILRHRRLERGAIELTLPEVKVELDRRGRVTGARTLENTESHQIIEEFMLAANEAVAATLRERGIDFLRRVHGSPDPRKLKALTTFVRELGIDCESLESRFEIKRVVDLVKERPERQAVNYAVLRSMQKAIYAPTDEGHYALHSRDYCHFTSPIRRYPDLTVHRIFDWLDRGKRPHETIEALFMLGEHCSEREQRAERAERELIKVKLLTYLSERIGEKFEAVITGVESFGVFAQGLELPAEGLIHVQSLRDDYYDFDATTHSLVGRRAGNAFRLGDVITVEIGRVDVDRRELDLRLVKRVRSAPKLPPPSAKRKRKESGKDSGNESRKGAAKGPRKTRGRGRGR